VPELAEVLPALFAQCRATDLDPVGANDPLCRVPVHGDVLGIPSKPRNGEEGRGVAELVDLAINAPHAKVLDDEIVLDPVLRPLAPHPDSFTPPKGATSVEMIPVLMPTMPYSRASATRQTRLMSRP